MSQDTDLHQKSALQGHFPFFFFLHFPSFPEAQKFMIGEIYLLVKFMITKNPSNS